jgi:hypothetical protein
MLNKTAEYRLTLSRLIVTPAPVEPLPPSIGYPDRHKRTDKQIAIATLRYLGAMFFGLGVAIVIVLAVR